ncbi:DUF917 domain-containing protein [Nonomuraea terrae]|uniref:DUF917 domain-containing protein n=1 Tax=Nonomuraea terrae TaxID=2530383 RepID=A0A4R4YNP7_9ACTN|nr:DUF917 domain-containing protein [Nonomuraea terrae]
MLPGRRREPGTRPGRPRRAGPRRRGGGVRRDARTAGGAGRADRAGAGTGGAGPGAAARPRRGAHPRGQRGGRAGLGQDRGDDGEPDVVPARRAVPGAGHRGGGHAVSRLIDLDELGRFSAGARVFATGAGDSPYHLALDWARSVAGKGVELVTAGELKPETLCVAVSLAGSTTALGEHLPRGDEPERAVRALERRLGERAGAVVALNLAAENALVPLIAAAMLRLPLVDGDGSGRVFPLVEQTTYALGGMSPAPLALAGGSGELILLETEAGRVEELLRPVVLAVGGWAVVACYPMAAADLARVLVPGTVSLLIRAGTPGAPRSAAAPFGVRRLCRGLILSVEGSTGHDAEVSLPSQPSSIVLREPDGMRRLVRLEAHNEIVLALADGAVVATVPDQICMICTGDGMVVDVDEARPGLEVDIMVVKAAPVWHTERGLALGGPRAFGIAL